MAEERLSERLRKIGPWGYIITHLEEEIEKAREAGDEEVLAFLEAQKSDDPSRDTKVGALQFGALLSISTTFTLLTLSRLEILYKSGG